MSDYNDKYGKERVCVVCGSAYKSVKESQTCSPKCRGELKSSHYSQKLNCKVCGKEFKRANSTIADGKDKTCSIECMHKLPSLDIKGEKHWNWQGGKREKACPICGAMFSYFPDIKKVQQFCSYACKYKHLSQIFSGSGNNLWKGGTSILNDKLRFELKEWKARTLEINNYTCFITGERGRGLDIHHGTPFYKIRDKVLKRLNLDYQTNRSEYTNEELESIVSEFKAEHTKINGYPILKGIHKKFHKQYGNSATDEQFLNFTNAYKGGCLKFQL